MELGSRITQGYFDSVVSENMRDFGQTWEAGAAETRQELALQGVRDLSHIDFSPPESRQPEVQFSAGDLEDPANLWSLSERCKTSAASAVAFASSDALQLFRSAFRDAISGNDNASIEACCALAVAIGSHRPVIDIAPVYPLVFDALKELPGSSEVIRAACAAAATSASETTLFVASGGLDHIARCLEVCDGDREKFPLACSLLRTVVTPGGAEETSDAPGRCRVVCRGKQASQTSLPVLTTDADPVEILIGTAFVQPQRDECARSAVTTLTVLAATDDVVEVMKKRQILPALVRTTAESVRGDEEPSMLRALLRLARRLCGNDSCRSTLASTEFVSLITTAADRFSGDASTVGLVCGCIGSLALGSAARAELVASADGIKVCCSAFDQHMDNPGAIRAACGAVRNMASRSEPVRHLFRSEATMERHLRTAAQKYAELGDIVHVALRELDLLQTGEYSLPFRGNEVLKAC